MGLLHWREISNECRDSVVLILSNGLTLGVLVAIFLHMVLPWHEDDDSLTVVVDGVPLPAAQADPVKVRGTPQCRSRFDLSIRSVYLSFDQYINLPGCKLRDACNVSVCHVFGILSLKITHSSWFLVVMDAALARIIQGSDVCAYLSARHGLNRWNTGCRKTLSHGLQLKTLPTLAKSLIRHHQLFKLTVHSWLSQPDMIKCIFHLHSVQSLSVPRELHIHLRDIETLSEAIPTLMFLKLLTSISCTAFTLHAPKLYISRKPTSKKIG